MFLDVPVVPTNAMEAVRVLLAGDYHGADCAIDRGHAAICKSVIDLAHNFGAKAVGVGVEKPADANALMQMDCDLGQGYLFAQPMAEDRFLALLRQRAERPTRQMTPGHAR